jgi:hypothetical protein
MSGEVMVGFGYKQGWLAIRDTDPMALAGYLGARDLGPVSWREGIDLAYLTDDRLVLTPPLSGARGVQWILAVGRWVLRDDAPVDLAKMSAELKTEVQLFATHRVVELHRWERAVDGQLVRAFSYLGEAGEVLESRGEPDAAELSLRLQSTLDPASDILVSESDVMRLAGLWSVDPTELDGLPAPGPLRAMAVP